MAFIGIDLGTTNSSIAIQKDGTLQILRDKQGNEVIPSVVFVDPSTRIITVGEAAKSQLQRAPQNAQEEIKRLMGSDETVQLGPERYSPQEISAMILKFLKEAAEDQLGEPVDRAVITVPANFPDAAREATKRAGELAGLTVERIINEPTAAALAYGHGRGIEEEVVMVYDLGGGTFDVSIIEYIGDVLEVKASAGDTKLGGKDFDRALVQYVAERYKAATGLTAPLDPTQGAYFRLVHACDDAKKVLSFNSVAQILIPFFAIQDGQPVDLDVEVSRTQFEALIKPLVDRTEASIMLALKDAGLGVAEVDRVILVGGSTRIPYVRALVERVMGKRPLTDVDPDRAVALGAAVQAAIIDGRSDTIIMDKSPLSLGAISLTDMQGVEMPGFYNEIITRNHPFLSPASEVFYTVIDQQKVIDFRAYRRNGDREKEQWAEINDEPNTSAGFSFVGRREVDVPPGPAGQRIDVTYTLNMNGNLDVQIDFENGYAPVKFQLAVVLDEKQFSTSKARMDRMFETSEQSGEVRATLHAAEQRLGRPGLNASSRSELTALIAALKAALGRNDAADVTRLEGLLTDLLFDLDD